MSFQFRGKSKHQLIVFITLLYFWTRGDNYDIVIDCKAREIICLVASVCLYVFPSSPVWTILLSFMPKASFVHRHICIGYMSGFKPRWKSCVSWWHATTNATIGQRCKKQQKNTIFKDHSLDVSASIQISSHPLSLSSLPGTLWCPYPLRSKTSGLPLSPLDFRACLRCWHRCCIESVPDALGSKGAHGVLTEVFFYKLIIFPNMKTFY